MGIDPRGMDNLEIRKVNCAAILATLRSHGSMSRRKIAELTQLSFPTVSRLVSELVKEEVVREVGSVSLNNAKRKTVLLDVNPDRGWVVAMELGGGHIQAAAMDLTGKLHEHMEYPLENIQGEAMVAPIIRTTIEQLIAKCEGSRGKPLAIGISSTGWVDPSLGVVKHSFNLQLNNFPIVRVARQVCDVPIAINDNIVASTFAEAKLGYGRLQDSFAYLSVGVGIGGGYVLNQQVLHMHSRSQFGLMVVAPEGDPERFEGRGYIESLASGRSIAASARKAIEAGGKSLISDMSPQGPAYITAKMVADAAREGDSIAIEIMEKATNYLGIAIVNVSNLFAITHFVLNGGVCASGRVFWDPLTKAVQKYEYWPGEIQLVPSSFQENAAVLGAGLLALDCAFELIS
ncbi:MAG: ROK family transcriptional regulator [Armatimonadota bacterium]|nr:ROK family transcriptional regulator [bacterium]